MDVLFAYNAISKYDRTYFIERGFANPKSQCDESVPYCLHCQRRGLLCPGYKAWIDVAWKDQNLVAQRKVQRYKNATKRLDRQKTAGQALQIWSKPNIPMAIRQDIEDYATKFFFSSYIFLPEEMKSQLGYLDGVFPVWADCSPTSPLKPALLAVASFMLEAWSELRPDVSMAWSRSHYLKGLSILRQSLREQEGAGDHVLLACLLLDMYESLHAFLRKEPRQSPHINGTIALIRHHRRTPFASEISKRVMLNARNQVVQQAYERSEIVPPDVWAWTEIVQDVPRTPKSDLDDLYIEAANLKAQRCRMNLHDRIMATATMRKAVQFDRKCQNWRFTLPRDWSSFEALDWEATPKAVRDAGLYRDYCLVYKNIFVANAFNRYCCLRIGCQRTILDCLAHHAGSPPEAWDAAQATIQEMADMICASVPSHLGDRNEIDRMDAQPRLPSRYGRAAAISRSLEVGGGVWRLVSNAMHQLPSLFRCEVAIWPTRMDRKSDVAVDESLHHGARKESNV